MRRGRLFVWAGALVRRHSFALLHTTIVSTVSRLRSLCSVLAILISETECERSFSLEHRQASNRPRLGSGARHDGLKVMCDAPESIPFQKQQVHQFFKRAQQIYVARRAVESDRTMTSALEGESNDTTQVLANCVPTSSRKGSLLATCPNVCPTSFTPIGLCRTRYGCRRIKPKLDIKGSTWRADVGNGLP